MTDEELDRAVASLRTIGGAYDYVAAAVHAGNREGTPMREGIMAEELNDEQRVRVAGFGIHDEVIHACPAAGMGLTPCCGMSPSGLPLSDRMTLDGSLVTCGRILVAVEGKN